MQLENTSTIERTLTDTHAVLVWTTVQLFDLAGCPAIVRRAGAGEGAQTVGAHAAVQAGAVPAVVVLWACSDAAACAGDAAGLGGGDAVYIAKVIAIRVRSQRNATDSGTIVDPAGVVLTWTLTAVLPLHCEGWIGARATTEASVRAVAGEDPDPVGADAAVQAGAVPAVVELLARSDIASRAGDAAGLGGEHAGRVDELLARVTVMPVHI